MDPPLPNYYLLGGGRDVSLEKGAPPRKRSAADPGSPCEISRAHRMTTRGVTACEHETRNPKIHTL